ncbi:MAG: hypothetical protein QOH92_2878 [Chloroflexota bacterium]|nr:hypothetical protein [Chloroflexota bacterium]
MRRRKLGAVDLTFIRDSSYIGDGILIALGAIGVVTGVAQLASGRLPYPKALARLRRQLPETAEDVRVEGLVIALRATALLLLFFGIFMWHLLIGQRPDQTLQVIFWVADVTVAVTAVSLGLTAQTVAKRRRYVPRRESKESAARPGI